MEVQDHPDRDELSGNDAPHQVEAQSGRSYPIRLLHLFGGLIVIGFVIEVFPETTMVLRPHVVEILLNREDENIEEYQLSPYLDQLIHYDPLALRPVPFMNTAIVSITRPADHLIENYTSVVRLKEAVAIAEQNHVEDIQIYKRHYANPRTRH